MEVLAAWWFVPCVLHGSAHGVGSLRSCCNSSIFRSCLRIASSIVGFPVPARRRVGNTGGGSFLRRSISCSALAISCLVSSGVLVLFMSMPPVADRGAFCLASVARQLLASSYLPRSPLWLLLSYCLLNCLGLFVLRPYCPAPSCEQ